MRFISIILKALFIPILIVGCNSKVEITSIDEETITEEESNNTPPPIILPQDISSLEAFQFSSSSIILNWQNPLDDIGSYIITYQIGSSAPDSCDTGTVTSNINPETTTYLLEALSPNQEYSFRICSVDADNSENISAGITTSIVTNNGETIIYRSVGVGNNSALSSYGSTSGSLDLVSGVANFENPLPDNVGVGDVLIFNSNTQLGIISLRFSSTKFLVKLADGFSNPSDISNNTDWEIYRAYASVGNAESGSENPGITGIIGNFDTWSSGRDLVANNEKWYIALYADGNETSYVTVGGWVTSPTNNLTFFTPNKEYFVGASQRHNGTLSQGFVHNERFRITDAYVNLDGYATDATLSSGDWGSGVWFVDENQGEYHITNCIFKTTSISKSDAVAFTMGNDTDTTMNFYVSNSIFILEGTIGRAALYLSATISSFYLYNNTFYATDSYAVRQTAGDLYMVNNIIESDNGTAMTSTNVLRFDYNTISDSSGDSLGGISNYPSESVSFINESNFNLHLDPSDISAQNRGLDLSNDSLIKVVNDIDEDNRPISSPDIGADEI